METNNGSQQLEILEEALGDTKKEESKEQQTCAEKKRGRKSKGKRPFPANSLQEVTRVPQVIREFNGGKPWSPTDIAKALKMGKGNDLYYLTASSRDYGFTEGTRDADEITLTSI